MYRMDGYHASPRAIQNVIQKRGMIIATHVALKKKNAEKVRAIVIRIPSAMAPLFVNTTDALSIKDSINAQVAASSLLVPTKWVGNRVYIVLKCLHIVSDCVISGMRARSLSSPRSDRDCTTMVRW